MRQKTEGKLKLVNCRTLMGDQPLTIYQKLILFGLSPEDRMILKYQTRHLRAGLAREEKGCGQSADSPANNNTIVRLARIDDVRRKRIVEAVADGVSGPKNREGVAVGCAVLAHSAVSGKFVLLGQKLGWTGTLKQSRS